MSFFDRMKKVMGEGFDSTRDFLGTAAERAKELGEKGVLRYEISRLERDAQRKFAQLGNTVYHMLVEKNQESIEKDNADIAAYIKEIGELEKRIMQKEKALKAIP